MKIVQKLAFHPGSREELLPDFESDFPYIASSAQLDQYAGRCVPWHWHKAIELFYIESGALEYSTPKRKVSFPAGSGGFVNSNVLHMTKAASRTERNLQRLHIFDPALISGASGSRIEKKYVFPIIANSKIDICAFHPQDPGQADILRLINAAFDLSEDAPGYEIKLREALSGIWLKLFELLSPDPGGKENYDRSDERLKQMLIYIHEHLSEKIAVSELAAVACLSERESFRLFSTYLHTTPAKYIQSCRLQEACRRLIDSQEAIADIGYACGLGDSSYFGRVFREYQNCTPGEYRKKWQDSHTLCPK